MSNKQLFLILKNLNYWKKSWFKSSMIMMLTALLVILIGVFTHSIITHSENRMFKSPGFRSIMISISESEDWPEVEEILNDYKEENAHVKSFSKELWGTNVHINNIIELTGNETPKNETRYGELLAITNHYVDERYLVDGRWFEENEQQVIILPQILSFNAISEEHLKLDIDYFDGSDLIGETIEVSYFSYKKLGDHMVKNKEYTDTFKVIGVYDNVRANMLSCYAILDYEKIFNMVSNFFSDGEETLYPTYSLMVDDETHVNQVIKELNITLKDFGPNVRVRARPGLGLRMIEPFMQLVLFTSFILFFLGFLLQVVLVKRIIQLRTNEIGTLKAMGYEDSDVNFLMLMEIGIWAIGTFIATILLSLIIMAIGQILIHQKGALFFRDLKLIFSSRDLIFTFIMLTLLPVLACVVNLKKINAIQPLDAIVEVME